MGQFKPMPKMETTEPSVTLKLKKGGKVKMMDGGMPPAAVTARPTTAMSPMQRRAAPPAVGLPRRPASPGALMRKKGGSVDNEKAELKRVRAEMKEDREEERNEHEEIKRVQKELKSHEAMKASKAHKGLATGGVISKDGSKTGSVEQFRGGYKKGGKACMADGGMPGLGGSLTPATRAAAERVRPSATPAPSVPSTVPTPREMQLLRDAQAEAKRAAQEEAAYNAAARRKTGGVVKKYAAGGVVKGYKSGGECMSTGGFSEMKKMKNW